MQPIPPLTADDLPRRRPGQDAGTGQVDATLHRWLTAQRAADPRPRAGRLRHQAPAVGPWPQTGALELALQVLDVVDEPRLVMDVSAGPRVAADTWDVDQPPVAAVRVAPTEVALAVQALTGTRVRVAAWVPDPLTDVRAVREAVHAGADEVIVRLDAGAFRRGRYSRVLDRICTVSEVCGDGRAAGRAPAHLRVEVDPAGLGGVDDVHRALWLALLGGADFVGTAAGAEHGGPPPDPWSTLVVLELARRWSEQTGGRAGVVAAGVARTVPDVLTCLAVVRGSVGASWATPGRLRMPATAQLGAALARRRQAPGADRVTSRPW